MTEVTIGMPFFNAADTILDAIRSVFAQKFEDWRLILVDDGSTDASVELARSVKDTRVELLADGRHRGLPARLNQIISLTTGPYVARMDADDLMHPERLHTQWRFLEENPCVDLVSTGMYSIDVRNGLLGRRGEDCSQFSTHDLLTRRVGIAHATVLARTAWAQRNPYDEAVVRVEDLDLWIRASKRGDLRIQSLETPLYFYRELKSLNLRTLLRTQVEEARLIRRHSTNPMQFLLAIRLAAKATTTTLLAGTGQLDALLRRRNRKPLTASDYVTVADTIGRIRAVRLPRLDGDASWGN